MITCVIDINRELCMACKQKFENKKQMILETLKYKGVGTWCAFYTTSGVWYMKYHPQYRLFSCVVSFTRRLATVSLEANFQFA